MKSNTFNYSLLAVGVAAVMGLSTGANAAGPTVTNDSNTGSFNVKNQAEATYKVAGNATEQKALSNEVTIKVNELSLFTLENNNVDRPINPQANSTVEFTHTLTNTGNVNDSYKIKIVNVNTGDDFNYNTITTTYVKSGTTTVVPIASDGTASITLAPGESATLTTVANSNTVKALGANGILTVSAESAYLTTKNPSTPAAYTATNTDNAKAVAPLYAITKSAKTNLNNNNGKIFDVNNNQSYIIYSIQVKNEGTADGTLVNISDTLPPGLVAIKSGEDNYVAPITTVNTPSGTTASAPVAAAVTASEKTITVTGQNIKIGETVTVTFRARKDATVLATNATLENFALVEDSTKDDATKDISDKSNDTGDTVYETKTSTTYFGKDNNTDSSVTTSAQTRAIAISPGVNKEIGLVTPASIINENNTYTYTVTNNGTDITEAAGTGQNDNAVKLSILPTANKINGVTGTGNNADINIVRVFVDANSNGKFDTGEIELTGTGGVYDLNAATPFVTGSTTVRKGLAPTESVKIGVQVFSTGKGSNDPSNVNNLGDSETLTVSVQPKGPVNGTAIPVSTTTNPLSTTSTTTLQGINLVKRQALDVNCNGTIESTGGEVDFTTGEINSAKPDQCIIYQITANSTFSAAPLGLDITSLKITDLFNKFSAGATYQVGTATSSASTDSTIANPVETSNDVSATASTLKPQGTATLQFRVKTKNAR